MRVFFSVVFSVEDLMFVRVTLLVVSDLVTLAVVLVVVEVSLARVAEEGKGILACVYVESVTATERACRLQLGLSAVVEGFTYLCPSL